MNNDYYSIIKNQYEKSHGDSTDLFKLILTVAEDIGLANALTILEQCVIEKRTAWLDKNEKALAKTGNVLLDGYNLFYKYYLGLSIPEDGEIVEFTDRHLTIRWRNPCPTLDACQKLGLDTREICSKVYEKPVQIMLSRLDARLRFRRNYAALRPRAAFCEESIELADPQDTL